MKQKMTQIERLVFDLRHENNQDTSIQRDCSNLPGESLNHHHGHEAGSKPLLHHGHHGVVITFDEAGIRLDSVGFQHGSDFIVDPFVESDVRTG